MQICTAAPFSSFYKVVVGGCAVECLVHCFRATFHERDEPVFKLSRILHGESPGSLGCVSVDK
eukprot:1305183-Rhodomonas_salina.1